MPVYANAHKPVPLPANAQPVTLHIPKDGRLVEWVSRPAVPAAAASPATVPN